MAKRKLTHQQQRRIRAARERKHQLPEGELGESRVGVVIARFGQRALVEDSDGERRQCVMRANIDSLVAGDAVIWRPSEETGVIESRDERRSELSRPDSRGNLRPVAANIDLMFIVFAPKPEPHGNLIDRYLVAAENAGMEAVLVLNKRDLLTHNDPVLALAESYTALGYTLIKTDKETDPHADLIRPVAQDRTLVLVGQSGVGKSSLINRLIPDLDIRVGALSEAIDKGRHTTTAAELYHLPSGGDLIDSPGIREFHLHHLPADEVAHGFKEFSEYLGHCRFRDCQHDHEVGCAILEALEKGAITEARFNSYRSIVDAPRPD
jgi:ribosome biogenesis GTPase / thiamine phosphate phosphatase